MKTVKMYFTRDTFYTDPTKPLYLAGQVYDIEEKLVEKWLKRGAVIVSETEKNNPIRKQVPSVPGAPAEPVVPAKDEPEEKAVEVLVEKNKEQAKENKSSKGK